MNNMFITQLFFQVVLFQACFVNGRKSQADILYSDLFADYNKNVLPQEKSSVPVDVNMTFLLFGIREFDELTGKFSVMAALYLTWRDFRLKWNASLYNNTNVLVIPENKIWTPNPVIKNPYDSMKGFVNNMFPVTLNHQGNVIWVPGDIISSVCDVDVTYYPFDIQICELDFVCWGYTSYSLVLHSPVSELPLTHYSKHGEWRLVNTTFKSLNYGLSSVSVKIAMRRRPMFVVLNFILPVVCMTVLNLFVFVLPVESGERVSYSITVLLAIAVFFTLVGENLPKTSFRTAIVSYFLFSYLIISTVICAFVILSSSLYYADVTRPVPKLLLRVTEKLRSRKSHRRRKYALKEKSGNVLSEDDVLTWKILSHWLDNFALGICFIAIAVSVTGFFIIVPRER